MQPKRDGLRLMVYDATCRSSGLLPGLSPTWLAGGYLYGGLGRIDAFFGARTWKDALSFLSTVHRGEKIAEIQFWGHGKWGLAMIDRQVLDVSFLQPRHEHHRLMLEIRARMGDAEGLWWFRTCETFGGAVGHYFAQSWASFFQCRAAGHTYIIGPFQSGLHSLSPDESPSWPVMEGIAQGSADVPTRGHWSRWDLPNTITCLHGRIPRGW